MRDGELRAIDETDEIARRVHPTFPTGEIMEALPQVESGSIAEVFLRIGGADLLVLAGEVLERNDGGFDMNRLDESVLVFSDPSQADAVTWRPARQRGSTAQR